MSVLITNLFSNLLGFAFVFMMPTLLNLESGEALAGPASTKLLVAVLAFAVVEVLVFLPALLMIKDEQVERKQRNILGEFKAVLTNRNYIIWFMAQGIYSMGLTLITALVLDFATDILMFKSFIQTVVFGLLVFGTIMLCFLAWVPIAKRIGKSAAHYRAG